MGLVKSGCRSAKLVFLVAALATLNRPARSVDQVPRRLTPEQIERELESLDGWKREGDFIVKVFEFERFMEGIRFIGSVARVAEELEHHPDIKVRYTTVSLALQTHSAGGVTKWDVQLARAIDLLGAKSVSGTMRRSAASGAG